MSVSTWTCPVGVTFIQTEGGGSGATGASGLPQAWRGSGGGGGAYGRKRLAVVPTTVYPIVWGDGLTFNSEPQTTFNGATFIVNAGVGTNGGAVTPGMDAAFKGGDGVLSDNGSGVGRGGGGGAGRGGAGSNGSVSTGGAGGSNSPSATVGNGGNGGSSPAGAGQNAMAPSGGGGGMGGGGGIGADLSGHGSPGWILIYDDTDAHGFDPNRVTIGSFGSPPAPAPPRRKVAYAFFS